MIHTIIQFSSSAFGRTFDHLKQVLHMYIQSSSILTLFPISIFSGTFCILLEVFNNLCGVVLLELVVVAALVVVRYD